MRCFCSNYEISLLETCPSAVASSLPLLFCLHLSCVQAPSAHNLHKLADTVSRGSSCMCSICARALYIEDGSGRSLCGIEQVMMCRDVDSLDMLSRRGLSRNLARTENQVEKSYI